MRRIPLTAAMLAIVSTTLFGAVTSPDGSRLAFSFIGGPERIYVAGPEGSEPFVIVDTGDRDFRPEWFPDSKSLLFTSAVEGGPRMYRVDTDGGNLKPLLPLERHGSDGHPSPDRKQVVFFDDSESGFDLHILDLGTGQVARLTETPVFMEYAPRWSPDGKQIVFVGREKKEAMPDLWILDIASGDRRNITGTADEDEFHPSWSPDGTRIAFIRVKVGEFAVHVLDLDTGHDTRVAHEEGIACFSPHFTPDGKQITFTRNLFEGTREGLPGVFRVRVDGSGRERLTGVEPVLND